MVTTLQRRPVSFFAIAVKMCVPSGWSGLRMRDGNLDAGVEHLAAAIGRRLVGVATHVEFLRRAADVDRDRLHRELRVGRGLERFGLLGRGGLGGILGRSHGVALRLRGGLGGVQLGRRIRGLGGGLLLQLIGLCLGLIGLGIGNQLVGIDVLGVGARSSAVPACAATPEAIARPSRPLAAAFLASSAALDRFLGLGGAACSARPGAAAMASAFGTNSEGCEKSTGRRRSAR